MRASMFAALMLALTLSMAVVSFAAEPMAESWGRAYTFNQVIGMPVKNNQGAELGKITDLVFDTHGRVPFTILSYGGLLGIRSKEVAVPFNSLSFDRKDKHLVLDMTKERLEAAPAFRVSDLSHEKWAEKVYRYFGQQPYWTEGGGMTAGQKTP